VILAPSILAADFARLGEHVAQAAAGGAALIHADVMDGHFVPNLTLGPATVKALRRTSPLPIDVHMMVARPDDFIDAFADAGGSLMSVHVEAVAHLHRTLERIRAAGMRPGVAVNPATPLTAIDDALPFVDYVVIMSVNPGFGGQRFIASALDKVRRLKMTLVERRLAAQVEIDGGIDLGNIRDAVAAGVDMVVAGTSVFGAKDPEAAARELIAACA
jgi:ribulose-phosphate 3-epimerase